MGFCVPEIEGNMPNRFDAVTRSALELPGLFAAQTEGFVTDALEKYFAHHRGHFFLIGGPEEALRSLADSTYAPPEGGRLLLDGARGMSIHAPSSQHYLRRLSHLPGALLIGSGGRISEYNARLGGEPEDFLLPLFPAHRYTVRHHQLARQASEVPGVYFGLVATDGRGVVYRDGEAEQCSYR